MNSISSSGLRALAVGLLALLAAAGAALIPSGPVDAWVINVVWAEFEQQDDNTVVLKIPEGAPQGMQVGLQAQGGGSVSTGFLTMATGATSTEPITVTPDPCNYDRVVVTAWSWNSRYELRELSSRGESSDEDIPLIGPLPAITLAPSRSLESIAANENASPGQSFHRLTLYDATDGEEVAEITDGATIDATGREGHMFSLCADVINVSGSFESIRLKLTGAVARSGTKGWGGIDRKPLDGGLNEVPLVGGDYRFEVSTDPQTETVAASFTISGIPPATAFDGFTLIDGLTGLDIQPIEDGMTLDLSERTRNLFNVRADVSEYYTVSKVAMTLIRQDGNVFQVHEEEDYNAPYLLFGGAGGLILPNGEYLIEATPETVPGSRPSSSLEFSFTITGNVANVPAEGAPAIYGTARVGETLTAVTSAVSDANGILWESGLRFQWLADDTEIEGATQFSHTLTAADVGKAIKVRIRFYDGAGFPEQLTSEATAAVAARTNTPATGAPTISGTAQVGETLTADTSGIADGNGLDNATFSYQWLADDTGISGAAGSTYTLADADQGKAIKVQVSFTDDGGNQETLTSEATASVAAAAAAATELPARPTGLSAAVFHDHVDLTWDDPEDDTITGYEILRRDKDVHEEGTFETVEANTGSKATTYTDTRVDLAKSYVYRIKALNALGKSEFSSWVRAYTPAAPSGDATLSGLSLDGLELSPVFTSYKPSYTASAGGYFSETTVTVTTGHAAATIEIAPEDADDTADGHQVALSEGSNTITVTVTAEDAQSTLAYVITVTRASPPPADAQLSELSLSGLQLSPAFANDSYTYTALAGADVGRVTLLATPHDHLADVEVGPGDADGPQVAIMPEDADPGEPEHQVALSEGENTITVTVTAKDGGNAQSYTVVVTRAAPEPPPSPTGGFVQVDAGWENACAIRVDGTAECWKVTPGRYPGPAKTLPDGTYTQLVVAKGDVCAVRTDGGLSCTGWLESLESIPEGRSAVQVDYYTGAGACRLDDDGSITCRNPSGDSTAMLDSPPQSVSDAGPFTQVVTGTNFACGLNADGLVKCWTDGTGELAAPETGFKFIGGGGKTVCGIKSADSSLQCWSWSFRKTGWYQAPYPDSRFIQQSHEPEGQFVHVDGGYWNFCAVKAGGDVVCWDTFANSSFGDVPEGEYLTVSTDFWDFACGLRTDKTVACWGNATDRIPSFESPWKDSADLLGLALSEGDLSPAFDREVTSYTATVAGGTTAITVVPELTNTLATHTVSSDLDPDASDGRVDLAFGDNTINVTVTSADGTTTEVYTVVVDRQWDSEGNYLPSPRNLRAVTQENGSVELTWEAPGDGEVTGYRIERSQAPDDGNQGRSVAEGGTAQTLVEDTGSDDTGYTDASAQEGVVHLYRVRAINEAGAGQVSSWVRAAPGPNTPATGAPSISGTAQVGQTLTAGTSGIADEDGLDNATFAYQWLADDTDISGATGSSYTLADADEGKAVRVQVSFTDDAGNSEELTSDATAAVAPAPDGDAFWSAAMAVEWVYQGYGYYSTASKKAGSLTPDSFEVDGAAYTVTMIEGNDWSMYIGLDRELPFGFVLELGGVQFASGDASFNSYSYGNIYRWLGANLNWNDGDTVEVRLLPAAEKEEAVNNPATGAPTISGTAQVSMTLTAEVSGIADADGLANATFSYQWLADDAEIAGATGSTHTVTDSEKGKAIKVRVSFTDDAGNEETLTSDATEAVTAKPNSPATGEPSIGGTAQVGETLTADTSGIADEDGLENATFSYQWQADGDDIAGATGITQVLTKDEEGLTIRVRVSFTDDADNEETLASTVTDMVAAKPNSPATGAPTISGTPQVGETLSANTSGISDEDGLDNATFTHQWLADGYDISGATGSSYTLLDADEGRAIKVQVSFTDDAGNDEASTSAATAAVEPKPNSPASGAPTISGTAQVGETLTADVSSIADEDGLDNAAFIYQWLAIGADIPGATSSTYTLADADDGKAIRVTVSFTDDGGNDETLTSAATDTVASSVPTEPPAKPRTLRATEVSHDKVTLTWRDPQDNTITGYIILRRDKDVHEEGTFETVEENTGTAATTYTDTSVYPEKRYVYRIKAINAYDESEISSWVRAYTPAAPAPENTPATGTPTISGTVQVGETLTADTSGIADGDGLENATFSYQWLADDADIDGATASSYTLADAEEGKAVKLTVSFTDDAGNSEELTSDATAAVTAKPNSPASGQPTISGAVQVGETLTADVSSIADQDGLANAMFSYQWLADDSDITGATSATYTLPDADKGKAIRVRVSFTDNGGNEETLTSAATAPVAARPNSAATGAPTINGTAQVGETFTAETSGITDEDGSENAAFTYQWLADDAEIAGATNSTYNLVSGDVGKAIKVRVSFTDDGGNEEVLTSAATAAVAAKPIPLTAEFRDTPTSHDGNKAFTFELRFSEHFGLSYKKLRDHAFTVTGGEVTNARRLEQGSNARWEITVRPNGNAGVTVVLPVTENCEDQGAICTGDGRKLSNRTELTVSGPSG